MDYHISTITLNTFINQSINLYDLSTYLKIDNDILGYKYKFNDNIIIKGIFKGKKSNSFFNNQLTLKLKHPKIDRIINVKIFNNGSFHFTGCTATSDAELLTEFLINKINTTTCEVMLDLKRDDNGIIFDRNTNIIYQDNYLKSFGQKESNYYLINNTSFTFDKKRRVFISSKFTNKSKDILDMNGIYIGYCKIQLLKGTKLYKNDNINIDMEDDTIKYRDTLIGNIIFYTSEISNNIISDPLNLSDTNYKMQLIENYSIITKINCINVCFNLKRKINRIKLVDTLKIKKYTVVYNPDIYSGVKLGFKQNTSQKGLCNCKEKCNCNTITFLIFESGNIIATNFKDVECINSIIDTFLSLLE